MNPAFSGDQILVFYANSSGFDTTECLAALSEKEIRRAGEFLLPADKNSYIFSRAILKQLLARFADVSVNDIVIQYAKNGKPFLAGNSGIRFSCAHTGDVCVIGLAYVREIGVDVEKTDRLLNVPALQNDVFTPSELQHFHNLSADRRQEAFIEAWIRKEALLKATGDGLTRPMSSVPIAFPESLPVPAEIADWFVESHDLPGNYRAAVAVNGPVSSVRYGNIHARAFSSPKAS